ncbi:twin-arginine translocation signal domain-containing protein [Sedimenticola selenatireducens]|uniref:Formate dehydrogenase n=1 Tax=Sedimenticola selenatireducens TaxID=191960 RepID=A0A2N6CXQ9_9GAMM|nr:twin-arginine translocation signal domain-containing protein [Sedimenticola selenatireducens]PLX62086.1 MAG: formate dehydrogenase [Sedimenticola selenatireducens]
MKQDQKKHLDSELRKFIKGSLVTGVGVATATVLPGVVVATEEDSPGQPKEQKGYRLTPHILEYYKTTAS